MKNRGVLKLPQLWLTRWKALDPFWHIFHLQGEVYREQPGRKTLRFIEDDQPYFVKLHEGVGWGEIWKNLWQGRLPVLGAKNELRAIQHLEKFSFTPIIIGYGWRGINPAKQESFLITKELSCTVSLEDFCRDWPTHPPSPKLKWALINKVAEIARIIHTNGVNHRDFYLCHFLLDLTGGTEFLDRDALTLYLIDLHRAQIRKKVPLRWRIKDIAGLYFSAMDIGLTQRDLLRFAKAYNNNQHPRFWRAVRQRAVKLYRKTWRQLPQKIRFPFYIPLGNQRFLRASELIRSQPKKRMVIVGEWQHQAVLAKLFSHRRHAAAEIKGYRHLEEHHFDTPKLLYHGWSQEHALYVVLYQYEQTAKSFKHLFDKADNKQKSHLMEKLLCLLHQQYEKGLRQKDLHMDNFLVDQSRILTIDLATIRQHKNPLSLRGREKNLGILFAQLSKTDETLWCQNASNHLIKSVCHWRNTREKKHLRKVLRNCSGYLREVNKWHFWIMSRKYDSPEFRELIKNLLKQEPSLNKIIIDNKTFHIEPFTHQHWYDYFLTPARRRWLALQKQYFAQQFCPTPVALIEKRYFYWKNRSYLITRQTTEG